ncbi:outer membrane protein [Pseudomonas sp.]|uniref:outer membrane protein n=1 Tax=Pseudomonas sp. TaxID=306 RepID=UPI003C75335E
MRHSYLAALSLLSAANLLPALAYADSLSARDWSGAYLGASLGGAEGDADAETRVSSGSPTDYFSATDPTQLAAMGEGNLSQWNASAGVFAGYGVQSGDLYWGIEASLNSLSFDESRSPSPETVLSIPPEQFSLKQSVEADWQGTLRGRLGWAQDQWLAYVTAGVAVTRVKLEAQYADTLGVDGRGQGSSEETKTGWVVGLGGEYALSERCSLRGEYLYADYGSLDTTFVASNPGFPGISSSMKHKVDFKTQTLSLGLAYRF